MVLLDVDGEGAAGAEGMTWFPLEADSYLPTYTLKCIYHPNFELQIPSGAVYLNINIDHEHTHAVTPFRTSSTLPLLPYYISLPHPNLETPPL